MGAKTKIDWCDSTWNPVTGCLHGCAYCYARKIAERFGGVDYEDELENRYGMYDVVRLHAEGDTHELDYPLVDAYSGKKRPIHLRLIPPSIATNWMSRSAGRSPAPSLCAAWPTSSASGFRTNGLSRYSKLARRRLSIGSCFSPRTRSDM